MRIATSPGQPCQSERRSSRIAASTPMTASSPTVQEPRAGKASGARSCGIASHSTVPTQSATSVASSQNCGPKDFPRVESSRPTAAIATQGKKANWSRLDASCSAAMSNERVAGTASVAASWAPSASASQRQALRRSDFSSRRLEARQATEMAARVAAIPVKSATSSSPGSPAVKPVTAEKTVSPMQSSTSQAAEWSNHGARASRSPFPGRWFRSSSIERFSLLQSAWTGPQAARRISSMVT